VVISESQKYYKKHNIGCEENEEDAVGKGMVVINFNCMEMTFDLKPDWQERVI
jgi:hypothetical protein